jgi:hypothetical protein
MEELIKQAFLHVEVIGPHVQEGHYDLIGPNGEIILPQVWETVIEPDWSITMHMWPPPEPKAAPPERAGPPGPPPMDPNHPRPRSGHGHRHPAFNPLRPPTMPPGMGLGAAGLGAAGLGAAGARAGPPPPPLGLHMPPGVGAARPPPPPPQFAPGPPPPQIVTVMPGKPTRRKTEPAKGVLGWMAGKKPAPSSKGRSKK